MKTFDCSLRNQIPEIEIKAKNEKEAKALYIEALIRALTPQNVDAIEVEIVQ
jgi:hypothetical protein